LIVCGTI